MTCASVRVTKARQNRARRLILCHAMAILCIINRHYSCDLVALGRSSLFIFIALIVVVRRKSVAPPEDMAAKLAKADEMLEREKE